MPFDDSLIGSNDFDPRTATEDLIRRTSDEPLPDTLDPRMLNTRLARKLGRAPKAVETPETTPKSSHTDELDFSSQAAPAPNMEPGGKDAVNLRIAEQYVIQFGNLAKETNTLILPQNLSDIGGTVAALARILDTGRGNGGQGQGSVAAPPPLR